MDRFRNIAVYCLWIKNALDSMQNDKVRLWVNPPDVIKESHNANVSKKNAKLNNEYKYVIEWSEWMRSKYHNRFHFIASLNWNK